jgi:hypothetical protein
MGRKDLITKKIDAALWYLTEKKYSVIPVRGDKIPYIKWEKYQNERATEEEVRGWWKKWPDAMIGIITGKISDKAEEVRGIKDFLLLSVTSDG